MTATARPIATVDACGTAATRPRPARSRPEQERVHRGAGRVVLLHAVGVAEQPAPMAIPPGRQLPKIIDGQPDEAAAAGLPVLELQARPPGTRRPARPARRRSSRRCTCTRYTLTPNDSAAYGASPTDRSRRPEPGPPQHEPGATRSARRPARRAATGWCSSPRMMPARSETKNQPLSSMSPSQSDSHGRVIRPTSGTGGDCRCPPPGASVNSSRDRYRVRPGARMLIATPEMMWSTPTVIVTRRVQQPAEQAADDAEEHPGPGTPLVAGVAGAERAEDHHSLDADVDHAGPFRPQAGQPGQRDRARPR